MKLFRSVILSLSLLQSPILAFDETVLTTPDLNEAVTIVSLEFQRETERDEVAIPGDRSLQHLGYCPSAATTWTDKVVLEVAYDPSCFVSLLGNQDVSKTNGDVFLFVTFLETLYKSLYNRMVGRNKLLRDWAAFCDPYARTVSTASVTRITRRSTSGLLAVEMLVTATCKGCSNTALLKIFDTPTTYPGIGIQEPSVNCACSSPGDMLKRAPFESEFYTQLQQIVDNNNDRCVKRSLPCSFGTPFGVDWEFDLQYDEGVILSDTEKKKAADAFIRASNIMYTSTSIHCQPEYRRIEEAIDFRQVGRRLVTEDDFPDLDLDNPNRKLQRRASVKMLMSTRGSTVAPTPPHIDTLTALFLIELGSNSVIKGISNLTEVVAREGPIQQRKLQKELLTPPTERTLQAVPNTPSVCPMVNLDFNNIVNPMAMYYGQVTDWEGDIYTSNHTFQGGFYLYDQLWWSHGVKVSARIKDPSHKLNPNIWIPKFDVEFGWTDSKLDHIVSDYRTGGAVRLFDTMRPGYSAYSWYDNDFCGIDEGDPSLGSPNHLCSGGGPGTNWMGSPQSVYANCVPQGLVIIIQETNSTCPDDTTLGGIITFEFREPLEFVQAMSFLNLKEPPTPVVRVFHGGNKVVLINTPNTGGNGLYKLPFATDTIKNVTRIEVTTFASGAISNLQYPYCAKQPRTKISVKKYGGPATSTACSAANVRNLGDVEYLVPRNMNWAYCYVISVPLDSDECFVNVGLFDSSRGAPIPWYPGDPVEVLDYGSMLCPGQVLYVAGPPRRYNQAPEASGVAYVRGFGKYGGFVDSEGDGVTIRR